MALCPVKDCGRTPKPGQMMCWWHWRRVPRALNRAIFDTFRNGPWEAYRANRAEAIRIVNEKEEQEMEKEEPMNKPVEPDQATARAPAAKPMSMADKAMMFQLCTVLQQTFAPWRQHMMEQGATPNSDMLLACAVATFAGTIVGETVGTGVMAELSVPSTLDVLRRNMDAGVEVGRKHVARIAEEVMKDMAKEQGTEAKQ